MVKQTSLHKVVEKLAGQGEPSALEAWVVIGAATQEVESASARLTYALKSCEAASRRNDQVDLAMALMKLRELFDHLGNHCEEARSALTSLASGAAKERH